MDSEKAGLVYVASPYSDDSQYVVEKRFVDTEFAMVQLYDQGYLALSPILLGHAAAKTYGMPKDFDYWKKLDTKLIEACDSLFVLALSGWDRSVGVLAEIKIAHDLGKPIHFVHLQHKKIWVSNRASEPAITSMLYD